MLTDRLTDRRTDGQTDGLLCNPAKKKLELFMMRRGLNLGTYIHFGPNLIIFMIERFSGINCVILLLQIYM